MQNQAKAISLMAVDLTVLDETDSTENTQMLFRELRNPQPVFIPPQRSSAPPYEDVCGPLAPFGAPCLKPFFDLRATVLRYRHRPLPVVFLLNALALHWYSRIFAAGYPHFEQVCFWMWRERRPHRLHSVCVLFWRLPKLEVPFVIVI